MPCSKDKNYLDRSTQRKASFRAESNWTEKWAEEPRRPLLHELFATHRTRMTSSLRASIVHYMQTHIHTHTHTHTHTHQIPSKYYFWMWNILYPLASHEKCTNIMVITDCLQTLFDGLAIRFHPPNTSKFIWSWQKTP